MKVGDKVIIVGESMLNGVMFEVVDTKRSDDRIELKPLNNGYSALGLNQFFYFHRIKKI